MPDGVDLLREMGVELVPGISAPFYGVRYIDGDSVAEGRFPGASGLGIRRTALHAAMARRAADAGVLFSWRTETRSLLPEGIETSEGPFTGGWIVGADGLHSAIREQAGLAGRPVLPRRYGIVRHFDVEPWTDCVEVYWSDRAEAYVTPLGPRAIGVAILWRGTNLPFAARLAQFPALAPRLDAAVLSGAARGAGPFEQRTTGVVQGNIALVGDAAGYLDALTGEGLALAFRQAFALVEAIGRARLEEYARAWRRIARRPWTMTRLLLYVEKRPDLRTSMVDALAADQALFSRIVGVHAGQLPVRAVLGVPALRLAARLVLR